MHFKGLQVDHLMRKPPLLRASKYVQYIKNFKNLWRHHSCCQEGYFTQKWHYTVLPWKGLSPLTASQSHLRSFLLQWPRHQENTHIKCQFELCWHFWPCSPSWSQIYSRYLWISQCKHLAILTQSRAER